jgi:alkylhydroperoxidase family enzyme
MRKISFAVVVTTVALCAVPAFSDAPATSSPKTMSRAGIPYKPDDDQAGPKEVVDAIRARRPGGKLLNLDRILLHSPAFAKGWNALFGTIRGQLALPPKLRELSIMAVGSLNQADYEWAQHEKEFLAAGGTKEQLAALSNVATAQKNDKLFTEAERATLALTDEMTRSIKVTAATMKRIRAILPVDQVVELAGTIAGYNMASRFLVATGVELE